MISCPNCGKDIADDSVHCGYCGQEIVPGGGKKTIMGFGAITEDVLRKAAEEAKEARAQAEKEAEKQSAGAAGGFGERVESKLKIPKPVLPPSTEQDTAARTAPGKLSIPKLGIGIDDTADAKTEAMEPIASERSAPATIEEDVSSVVAPPEDTSAREPAGETDWRVSQTDPPGSWTGPGESTPDDWSMGEPDGSAGIGAEPTSPEIAAVTTTDRPLRLGEPTPDATELAEGEQTLPAKGLDTRLLLIPVALVVFGGLCCVGAVLFGWLGIL